MRSAFLLASEDQELDSFLGNWIWKLPSRPKIQMFIWKCMHLSIGVKECLLGRGMSLDTTCPRCHMESESISHALQDCSLVKPIWQWLGILGSNTTFFTQDTREWISFNASIKRIQASNQPSCNILFPFAIWLIWKQRNHVVLNKKGLNPNLAKVIISQAMEFFLCANRPRHNQTMIIKQVQWEKPIAGWMKLNTDGSSNDSLSTAG